MVMCMGLTVPALAVETYTETIDGITITAAPDGTISYSASVVQESDYFAAPGADCDLPVSGTGKVTLYLGAKRKNRL